MLPRTPQNRTEISATGKCPPGQRTSRRGHGRPTFRGDRKRIPTHNHDIHPSSASPEIIVRRQSSRAGRILSVKWITRKVQDLGLTGRPDVGIVPAAPNPKFAHAFAANWVANFGCRSIGRRESADPGAGKDAVRLVPVELSQILQRAAIGYGDQALGNPDDAPALPAAQTLVHAFARRADQIAELALREPDLRQRLAVQRVRLAR